jgi:hypothetical protein
MPREQINTPRLFDPVRVDSSTPPIHGEAWADPTLHVSWHREGSGEMPGHVQVALGLPVEYLKHLATTYDEAGMVVPSVDAFTPALSRRDLNKLIRTLRRARDQAYGADE